jgi:hypothetical protein
MVALRALVKALADKSVHNNLWADLISPIYRGSSIGVINRYHRKHPAEVVSNGNHIIAWELSETLHKKGPPEIHLVGLFA